MNFQLPHTIDNGHGETLTFKQIVNEPDGDKILVEGKCKPGAGPVMHVHYKQDECLTLVSGKMGYQMRGEAPKYLKPGETVLFKRNEAHRFWNAGDDDMIIEGWVKPVNTIVFYLSALYASQRNSKTPQPEMFDSAFLMQRYKSEYGLPELPAFVRKVIIPITYNIGNMQGKYKKFKDAPAPVR